MGAEGRTLLDADATARILRRLTAEIVEQVPREKLALVGIRRGGVALAAKFAAALGGVDTGTVDISLYRDDAATALPDPKIGPSDVRFAVDGRDIVLVDDVLQTGRTVRAAIDCLLDYGRPRRIWLAVLLDRGGRELPVAADFVGRVVEVGKDDRIMAYLDGEEPRVELLP